MPRRKKKKNDLFRKPFCYYCDRKFEDEHTLIIHQKARHFRCHQCRKKLASAHGLKIHCAQVHKEPISKVPNAIKGRDSTELDIHGMVGIPVEMLNPNNNNGEKLNGMIPNDNNTNSNTGNNINNINNNNANMPPGPPFAPMVPNMNNLPIQFRGRLPPPTLPVPVPPPVYNRNMYNPAMNMPPHMPPRLPPPPPPTAALMNGFNNYMKPNLPNSIPNRAQMPPIPPIVSQKDTSKSNNSSKNSQPTKNESKIQFVYATDDEDISMEELRAKLPKYQIKNDTRAKIAELSQSVQERLKNLHK